MPEKLLTAMSTSRGLPTSVNKGCMGARLRDLVVPGTIKMVVARWGGGGEDVTAASRCTLKIPLISLLMTWAKSAFNDPNLSIDLSRTSLDIILHPLASSVACRSNMMVDFPWLCQAVPALLSAEHLVLVHGEGRDGTLEEAVLKAGQSQGFTCCCCNATAISSIVLRVWLLSNVSRQILLLFLSCRFGGTMHTPLSTTANRVRDTPLQVHDGAVRSLKQYRSRRDKAVPGGAPRHHPHCKLYLCGLQ